MSFASRNYLIQSTPNAALKFATRDGEMSGLFIGAICVAGAVVVLFAMLNNPARKADDDLEAREMASMRSAKSTTRLADE